MTCPTWLVKTWVFILFFSSGSLGTVVNGMMLKSQYKYNYGLQISFRKPIFQTALTFFGLALFSISFIYQAIKNKITKSNETSFSWEMFRNASIPSLFFIMASLLQTFSLIYMPTTVWQVFYGFQVLFTTLFTVTYIKEQLYLVDWLGVFVNVMGICITGVSGLLRGITKGSESITTTFIMMIVAIASHCLSSIQNILEQKLMRSNGVTPTQQAAYEGLWGSFLFIFIILPVAQILPQDFPLYENNMETSKMITLNPSLGFAIGGYLVMVSLLLYASLMLISTSTALRKNMYQSLLPLFVWTLSVIFQYLIPDAEVDEDIDRYTPLELAGFLVSFIGSLIYNRVWRFPCLLYRDLLDSQHSGISEDMSLSVPTAELSTPLI